MHTSESASGASFIVRGANSDDLTAIARIWYIGWRDGHLGHVPPELAQYRGEAQFLSRARAHLRSTFVAELEDRVMGFVTVKEDELEQIFVDRTARGTGVAEALLHKGEAEIRNAGHRTAWLSVVAGNQRARSFYARHGWRDAGPFSYFAETEAGPFAVPVHRYEIDLIAGSTEPGPAFEAP